MQLDIFNYECQTPYVIKKPIRLIELFAGKGAQAKALERKKANFVHWRICEFDKYAVATYNAIHGTNFVTSDITQITAADLGITDTDKYEYIMTYSFPCTDLSVAGKQAGMAKGSGTRSGLLWEVERLLKECKELPQVLLMENVPQVLNCDFGGWLEFLEGLGYHNYYQKLNAKDYGIPQNRDRVFMVSTLGDYYYEFPKPIPLQLRLKDMLEPTVDEKYYLSEKVIGNLQLNKDISNAVRSGGRGSTDRHSWDLVKEPVILTPKRTEYGKAIRKEYEAGIHKESRHNFTQLEPKSDNTSNTITTVQKDNMLLEPLIYDAYSKRQLLDGVVGTLTAHGNTSNTHCGTFFVSEPVLVGGIGEINFGKQFRQGNRVYDSKAIACALNASPVGNTGGESYLYKVDVPYQAPSIIFHDKSYEPIYYSTNNDIEIYYIVVKDKHIGLIKDGEYWYAIRKLTPLECFRLMGFDDEDFYKAKAAGISDSQLYKIAGNSIVVQVLEHIFEMILKEDL